MNILTITDPKEIQKIKSKMIWTYSRELDEKPEHKERPDYNRMLLKAVAEWRVPRNK